MEKLEIGLYIVSTPIGNLEDISLRAEKILKAVDFIICENPIHSLKLLNKFGIKKKLLSLHDYNEDKLIKKIEKYQNNSSIALISDAGSPLLSDPGYNLIQEYIKNNIFFTTIPGPSSIISALQLSGMPINNFKFYGFISKNKSSMLAQIKRMDESSTTSVCFISRVRLIIFLETLVSQKIDRKIAVCKEITKKNERVFRGNAKEVLIAINDDKNNLRGEFTVLIKGKEKSTKNLDDKTKDQINKLLKKFSLTEVVELVHKLTDISKKEIYNATLNIKNE